MFKLLLKKQFLELFRSYFVNQKDGKARSKLKTVAFFVLFAFLMLFLGLAFFGIADLFGRPLFLMKLDWLFFAIMSVISLALGTFGSVFNTFTTLYSAKDNEALLSLPIPPRTLLSVRMCVVYAMSLLYSGCVWLPTLIYYWIFGNPTALSVIFGVLLFLVIALFVTVLTCLLGWVVALIAGRLKNKSVFTVIISLGLFALYYFLWFRMNDSLTTLATHGEKTAKAVKTWANLLYRLGLAAAGKVSGMLIFTGITLVLFGICFYILSRTFAHILTRSAPVKKATRLTVVTKSADVKSALFRRELKRFCASPVYMLNSGIGLLILLVIAAILLIKRGQLTRALSQLQAAGGDIFIKMIPFVILAANCAIIAINGISTPSVSLEGKNLWILRSLPLRAADILEAKLSLHIRLNLLPAFLTTVVACYCFKIEIAQCILILAFILLFIQFTGILGLIFGVLRPNFNWTSETVPVKQSLNVLFVWLIGWAIPIITGGGYYLLRRTVEPANYLCVFIVLLALAVRYMRRWLMTKGAEIFDRL